MAQDPAHDDNIDVDNFNIEDWIYTGAGAEPDAAPRPSARPKVGCQVRLFGSQETPPPVAFTEPQRAAAPMLSPGALHRVAGEVLEAPLKVPDNGKKGRKSKPKLLPSSRNRGRSIWELGEMDLVVSGVGAHVGC